MGANKIYLQVDFQSDNADAQIKKLNQEIASVGTTSQEASQKSSQSFKGFSATIEETQRAVFGLGDAIAALGVVRLGVEMAQSADKVTRLQIAVQSITGSMQEAADVMAGLHAVAAKSPFAFHDLAESALRLKGFGFEAARIPGIMATISSSAAALGGTKETIDKITLALGQMRAQDLLKGREIYKMLMGQGLPAGDILRAGIQQQGGPLLDERRLNEAIEKMHLGGKAAAEMLLRGFQEQFGQTGPRMMALVTVQFTKLTDELDELSVVIMKDVGPPIAALLRWFRELIVWFESLPPVTQHLIEGLLAFAAAAGVAEVAVKALSVVFTGGFLVDAVKAVPVAIEALGLFATAIGEVVAAGGGLADVGAALSALAASPAVAGFITLTAALSALAAVLGELYFAPQIIEALDKLAEKTGFVLPEVATAGLYVAKYLHEEIAKLFKLQEGIKASADLLQQNAALRAEAAKAGASIGYLDVPDASTTKAVVESQNRQITGIILAARKAMHDKLLQEDQAALEQLDQLTAAALDRARARAVGGIAAIDDEMAEMYRKIDQAQHPFTKPTATLDEDRARLAQARQLRVQQVVEEAQKQSAATRRELDQKAAEDRIADMKKASEMEVELAKQTALETQEARAMAAAHGYDLLIANEEKIRAATKAATAARQQDELDQYRSHLTAKDQLAAPEMIAAHIADVEAKYRTENEKADLESYERVAKYRVDVEKQVLEETRQLNEEAFQLQNQNLLDRAQHMGDLAKAAVDAIPAQTEGAKTAQANAAAQAEIDALQRVYDAQKTIEQAANDDNLRALDIQLQQKVILQDTYNGKVASMQKKQNAQDMKDTQDLEFEKAKLQIDAIKKHNEAVIADQKEVYDQIKSGVDKLWDAMTSRSETFAQRIGNMLKAAFLDAAKSIVTSHVAASLTEMFGKGHVGFGGGPMRQLLGTQPVFGVDKMQLPGHLSDVTTVNSGGVQSVPVTVMNPAPVQQQITQNVHVSTPAAAATMMSVPGLMGLGAAMSTMASPAGAGIPFVNSTVSFGGGGGSAGSGFAGGGGYGSIFSSFGSLLGAPGGTAPFAAASGGAGSLVGMFPNVAAFSGGGGGLGDLPITGGGMTASGMGIPGALSSGLGIAKIANLFGGAGGGISKALGLGSGGTFAAGSMIPGLGLGASVAGLMGARQLGTHGPAGLVGGAALGAFSGLLAAGSLAALFPSLFVPLLAAGPVGWIIAGGIGAAIGLSSLFIKTSDEKVRSKVKQVYGVDISDKNVRMQIVQIAKDRYGGNLDVAIMSPEVQDLVRLYSLATGKNPSNMPRPMYAATFTQSGAGGTSLQPVYQSNNIVANPYSGTTTTQYAQALSNAQYLQLDPTQALSLLTGQVTNIMNANPGQVAAANTAAVASGASQTAQAQALMEPLTVLR